jgi:hypothetical protein
MTGRLVALRPSSVELIDAAFLMVLVLIAIIGLNTTFTTPRYLVLAAVGAFLGILVAHLANVLRWHWLIVLAMATVAYFLVGGIIDLQDQAAVSGEFAPLAALLNVSNLTVAGWKDMLTTYPPLDGNGPFVVLPYLLAVIVGSMGFVIARRNRAVWPSLILPTTLLGVVIAIGTYEPAALLVQGLGFAVAAFGWLAVRYSRRRKQLGAARRNLTQLGLAGGILVVSLAGCLFLGPLMPGTNGTRQVLRSYIEPPPEFPSYSSPLVGFRNFSSKTADIYYNAELFKVQGDVAASELVRIAVMDTYNGLTYDATAGGNGQAATGFQRMGSTLPATVDGDGKDVQITIAEAYANNANLSQWLPSTGIPKQTNFQGANQARHSRSLLFNMTTGQVLLTDRLEAGDVYGLKAVPLDKISLEKKEASHGGTPLVQPDTYSFLETVLSNMASADLSDWDQLVTVANYLREEGYWSDGTPKGQEEYRPGHGQNRLIKFLTDPKPVGSDEQYAVAMSIAANRIGYPARVVLGAEVPADGVVKGQNVKVWVEILCGDGRWKVLPTETFTPSRDKEPEDQTPPEYQTGNTTVVPPPNPQHAPSWLDLMIDANKNVLVFGNPWIDGLIKIALWILRYIVPPLALLLLIIGTILGLKALRARRRQTRGPLTTRIAGGWREVVDLARDMGYEVPLKATRLEQAAAIDPDELGAVADVADRAIFSSGDPDQSMVTAFWAMVRATKRTMLKSTKRLRRWRAKLNLHSLLARKAT